MMTKIEEFVVWMQAELATREEGQGLVEYALIIALVSVVLVGALGALQGGIGAAFANITGSL